MVWVCGLDSLTGCVVLRLRGCIVVLRGHVLVLSLARTLRMRNVAGFLMS